MTTKYDRIETEFNIQFKEIVTAAQPNSINDIPIKKKNELEL